MMDFAFFILQQICAFDWLLEKQWVGTLESISTTNFFSSVVFTSFTSSEWLEL